MKDREELTDSQLLRQRNAYFEWFDWGVASLPHSVVPYATMPKIRRVVREADRASISVPNKHD
jgi:hypothetical protein